MEEPRIPTPREMAILKLLWDHGPSSVKDVHRGLLKDERIGKELAYNTVQTLLRIMEDKALVNHRLDGRTFVYTARYSREESARSFLERVFDGAASQFMLSLLEAEEISAEELDRIQTMIASARRKRIQREARL
ncbi:MAG TPA: BlaI/MecI/CopY family transcriptional regulator [Gemmataceae bacterium]|nr:BlaI/MecI/CopY family transcriptional regulator [Gemmataceae bacterium]